MYAGDNSEVDCDRSQRSYCVHDHSELYDAGTDLTEGGEHTQMVLSVLSSYHCSLLDVCLLCTFGSTVVPFGGHWARPAMSRC